MTAKPFSSSRRKFLQAGSAACLLLQTADAQGADEREAAGLVIGQPQGAEVGSRILREGGNAVDATVAAALVAGVVALPMCGIGGYGGHLVVGWPDGRAAAVDFNSAAPAAAREDMFPLAADGKVRGGVNQFGWLAAGVPGTLAGLQLAIDRFGTRSLSQLIEPAIRFARDGFTLNDATATSIRNARGQFERDPGSAQLFLPEGQPAAAGATFRNPLLAEMLAQLADANSVDSFYRGEIARHIAREFQKHGGLVTEQDLASYEARQADPLSLEWRGAIVYTPPLTAGGLSVLQTLNTLKSLAWDQSDSADPKANHARIEAMRLAWHDRLTLLGDPDGVDVPADRLLSSDYADASADRVRQAVRRQRLIEGPTDGRNAGGTIHLSAADSGGMMAALTLTHGEGFGARVTVDGLGLVLGHGMSRFEPKPGHPNSPRPGRRPFNNMCPTIVFRQQRPVAALGATGGRRIPNTLVDVLSQLVGRGRSLPEAARAPRLHTEGDATLRLAAGWSEADKEYLKQAGYRLEAGTGANLNGIARDLDSGAFVAAP